jgi:hypothetical protein
VGKTIVILFQAGLTQARSQNYAIARYARIWTADGHNVLATPGVANAPPGDVVIVHVDLSVVPDEYLETARKYPVALNAEIRDIRKSTFSKQLLKRGDPYDGPVIVKTDLNHAGVPEGFVNEQLQRPFERPDLYPVYSHPSRVPNGYWDDPGLIVEKLLAEREGDLYCVRFYNFIGDHGTCIRLKGPNPIVNGTTKTQSEVIEPDPEILKLRKEIKLDYGKLDYVMYDGRAVVVDVNKTVGAAPFSQDEELLRMREHRARGLYDFFR